MLLGRLGILSREIQSPERYLGSRVGDCERRDEGGELRADADRVPGLAQVTDRAPVTGQPRDLPNQVSSGRAAGEHSMGKGRVGAGGSSRPPRACCWADSESFLEKFNLRNGAWARGSGTVSGGTRAVSCARMPTGCPASRRSRTERRSQASRAISRTWSRAGALRASTAWERAAWGRGGAAGPRAHVAGPTRNPFSRNSISGTVPGLEGRGL